MKTIQQQQNELYEILDKIELKLMELVNEYDLLINKKTYYLKKCNELVKKGY
tara:strand:+ start:83 stop:238 length:156 start_codon:yes stop_codon:yes gene_type:complete